ncbi:DUF4238 domain-containing protein [Micromonospora sp. NPDC000663]|uniref:DUF4238 domain-containing protein n=1 Tax=Micromonospora sp. NPDC000663 TaxID=3364218 RepID=UPI0036AFE4A3
MANLADEWPFPGDPNHFVGARHHTVPRFYLEYWADADGHIDVVEKPGGRRYRTVPKTASAETDFYTYIDLNGDPAGHMEQVLGVIEAGASAAIGRINHPTFGQFPPPPDDKYEIATFLAFQKVRGKRRRREIETQADFYVKLQYSGLGSDAIKRLLEERLGHASPEHIAQMEELVANLDDYEFVPDPNEHVRMMGKLAHKIFPHLMRRHWYLGVFDEPVLVTCDEPVMLYKSNPSPIRGYGLLDADEVWFPLNPSILLILTREPQPVSARFSASISTARIVNAYAAHNAYQNIFLHPEQPDIDTEQLADSALFEVAAPPGVILPDGANKPLKNRTTARRRKPKRK